MGPATLSPEHYRERFRTALRLALAEGAPSVTTARSRAACSTWRSASGVDYGTAERVRSEVYREECERLGVGPLRAGVAPDEPVDYGPREEDEEIRVPRGRARTDARVRRGGKR